MKVYRFAPSPNGWLHLGHAYSALLNSDLAHADRGVLLLRIEDIDTSRCRPEFEAAIYEDLGWLGLTWDQPVRRQSDHFDLYREALAQLQKDGLIYPAFETRSEIAALLSQREAKDGTAHPWPRDPDGAPLYPGRFDRIPNAEQTKLLQSGAPFAWRLNMRAAVNATGPLHWTEWDDHGERSVVVDAAAWGDVIVARKDIPTSYHLSVVVDDALQGVTNVVRGRDLFHVTSVHRLLQTLLKLPEPHYRHHRLILDDQGRKLSKSDYATGLREQRAAGLTPNDIRNRIGLA